eukprot:TRINITY_DN5446_c0_g1_i2.p1 TRINITY_DN5446_c0_g1~~TRINITY_DN5446_c0_g1_i2.p1  ORF type:complete len:201 (-),score=43.20 TRINITY_DN5446_c0_g1_i2:24-626(-)
MANLRPTHFIALPLSAPDFCASLAAFQREACARCHLPPAGAIRTPHITIAALTLPTEELVTRASALLADAAPAILSLLEKSERPLQVSVSGLQTFQADPKKAKVLFTDLAASPLVEKLLAAFEVLRQRFREASMLADERFVPHITVFHAGRANIRTVDASRALQLFGTRQLGLCTVDRLEMCPLGEQDGVRHAAVAHLSL